MTIDHEHTYLGVPEQGWYSPKTDTYCGELIHGHDGLELHKHWMTQGSPHKPLEEGPSLFRFAKGKVMAPLQESY